MLTLQNLKAFLLLCLLTCVGFLQPARAQFQSLNLDSLNRVLQKEKTDSITFSAYLEKTSTRIRFTDLEAKLAIYYWILQHAKKKRQWYFVAYTFYQMGTAYLDNDDFVQGSKNLMFALKYAEEHKQFQVRAKTWSMLASVYYYNRQYQEARNYCKKVIVYAEKTNDNRLAFNGYHNLGLIYFSTSDTDQVQRDSALHYLRIAYTYLDPEDDILDIISFNTNISGFFSEMGEYDSALHYLNKTLPIIKETKSPDHYILYYHKMGKTLREMGKLNEAIKNYNTGLDYAIRYKSPSWSYSYYYELSQAYWLKRDFRKALEYNRLFHSVKDSIVNKENFAKATDLLNKYEREKREKKIIKLNKDNEIKKLLLERGRVTKNRLITIVVSVVVVLVLLGFLTVFLIRVIRERKKAYIKLQEKNIQIQNQSAQLSNQARLITKYQTQMNPHFVFNALNNIQGFVVNDEKQKTVSQLQLFSQLMRYTLSNSENEYILLESEIKYLNTYVAFEQERFVNKFDFSIATSVDIETVMIPPMMIQPFVENAIKHGGLHTKTDAKITVTITQKNEILIVSIKDNGKGMNLASDSIIKNSHAISIIKSRQKLLFESNNHSFKDDYFKIKSSPGLGTEITFCLPLTNKY
ncbi:MAG: tetratricopeptide repeat protein [Flavobacteriales bacterium]